MVPIPITKHKMSFSKFRFSIILEPECGDPWGQQKIFLGSQTIVFSQGIPKTQIENVEFWEIRKCWKNDI